MGNILRWFLYPFPIYDLTFGYQSISNREIIKFVKNRSGEATGDIAPYNWLLAGPPMLFLCVMIFVYWLMIYLFEKKVFDISNYRNRNINNNTNRKQSFATEAVGKNAIDEDIIEEETRVKQQNPKDLPVRIQNINKRYGQFQAVKDITFGLEYGECFALLGVSGAGKTTVFKCLTGNLYPT